MNILSICTEPAIIIITSFFIFFVLTVLKSYVKTEKELKSVYNFLKNLSKKEISYRFPQIDEYMNSNLYTRASWEDFKKALIFPEKLYNLAQHNETINENYHPEIYLTMDASYFFNEETLIDSKINHRFIQIMPTLLTGLGPFFTFLKLAIAFAIVDFASNDINATLNSLISNIQIAALCSVFAVGYSLVFMFIEKILYNKKCKRYYLLIQNEFIRLFDICTSEQFLLDLVKESKIQNITTEKLFETLPDKLAKSISKSIGDLTTPYLENVLYSLNRLNENFAQKSGKNDIVDKLF